jgi:pimeloyl-ACP methyl ester carboxylesterase
MDNAARTWQRVLAISLPVTAVLYISAEALSPKSTDQVISTTAAALKVRPADFGEYRDQVVASLRRRGYAKAFAATTRTSHGPAEARLADVTAPVLVVMGEQDPDFRDPRAEAGWIAGALCAHVVMVPEAGHYPQSQRPGITAGAVLRFLELVQGPCLGRGAGLRCCPASGATAWGYCP